MNNTLAIDVVLNKNKTILKPLGSLNYETSLQMENLLSELLLNRKYQIIIDCSELVYLTSDGLGGILHAVATLRNYDGDLKLACLEGKAAEIISLLGVDRIIQTFPTIDEAIEAFEVPLPAILNEKNHFAATKRGKTLHVLDCRYLEGKPLSELKYFLTLNNATSKGFSPCRICQPQD